MDVPPPPPQDDDPIITQFRPIEGQWELNDDNIKRIDPQTGGTILQNYCKYMDSTPLEVYRFLIETKGADVNAQDNNNDTPFHLAFRCFNPDEGGHTTVLMYLLTQENVNVNTKGYNGETLLHYACESINKLPLDVFKVLIEIQGCDVNVQAEDNNTPLHIALFDFNPNKGGDITVLTYLLSQKGVNGSIRNYFGYTLLHYVCEKINRLPLDIFKVLIETKGCDVNAQDNSNDTPLHIALDKFNPDNGGNINVLTYLINQQTVNVNIKDKKGHTLLHLACINNLLDSRRFVKLNAERDTILSQIVEFIAERCVQQVLDKSS
jgi:ankyrin repeat protein